MAALPREGRRRQDGDGSGARRACLRFLHRVHRHRTNRVHHPGALRVQLRRRAQPQEAENAGEGARLRAEVVRGVP
uniref:Uncharacterized protein n=1 Tax=Arundo donax TaxID=35708 RepID=A0A0A9H3W0_ARUDO